MLNFVYSKCFKFVISASILILQLVISIVSIDTMR